MKTHHDKLVRDRIPEIIKATGRQCSTRILSEQEYAQELIQKLHEEVSEFTDQPNLEELADILEVIKALADVLNTDMENLESIRKHKALARGAFEKRILLEWTD